MLSKLIIALLSLAVVSSAVIEASDKDIKTLLASGVPTILSIYASWCGHCKKFHPVLDDLAALYEGAEYKDKIQFIKIDGDKNRKVSKDFKVEYFPTIKWVEGSDNEPIDSRDLKSLKKLIAKKTGLKPSTGGSAAAPVAPVVDENKVPKAAPTKQDTAEVKSLDDSNLEKELKGKKALVAFTTTWCGHCKNLKPTWGELANLYSSDEDIVVANVDCTEDAAEELQKKFEIRGFPSIFYFDDGESEPYQGGRSISDFTDFFQKKGASFRGVDGKLNENAGLIDDLLVDSAKLIGAASSDVEAFITKVKASGSKYADKYIRIANKVAQSGESYIRKETERLSELLSSNSSPKQLDDFKIRLNILSSFLPSAKKDKQDL